MADWADVERIYHAALALPASERARVLGELCVDDADLRREVESLLAHASSTPGVLDGGAVGVAAGLMSTPDHTVLTGRRLGVYQVTAPLGKGGMGEVYRARDTRLGRDVAIKILPRAFTTDTDRLARFEREARVLASLNHPNIATIHGIEDGDGIHALVMELIEGQTLAERIAKGPIPIATTLPLARQIADALDVAHEKGIVHRDLKPANIKITRDGAVKVLDFGLAKAAGPAAGDDAPTMTIGGTRDGAIVGTAAYMSPEQARGLSVDKRTDIWAFGCVLYEMLTGRPAFRGNTVSDIIAAILEREPDWSALPADLPPTIRRLLGRSLEKDVRRRLRDVADARADLEEIPSGAPPTSPTSRANPVNRALAALVAGLVIALVAVSFVAFNPEPRVASAPSFSRIVLLTRGPAREWAPAISPDGKWVAYLSNERGPTDVWVKFLAGGDAANLTASTGLEVTPGTGIGGLEISPDGTRVAVMARMLNTTSPFETWEVPAPLPGPARKLLEGGFVGLRWSPHGRMISFVRRGGSAGDALWVANADGTLRREIIPLQPGRHIHWPTWSDDRHIYFIDTRAQLVNMEPSGISRVNVDTGQSESIIAPLRRAIFPMPMPDGNGLIFAANPATAELGLWWRSSDGTESRQLTSGIGEYAEPRVSLDGHTLVATLYNVHQSLIELRVDQEQGSTKPLTAGYTGDLDPSFDRIGNRLVFSSSRAGNRNLWTSQRNASSPQPLTSGAALDEKPSVSPDGRQVAFLSDRDGRRALWVINADGGAPRRVADIESVGGLAWSRDGREVLLARSTPEQQGVWAVSAADGGMRQILKVDIEAVGDVSVSPTRDLIAYVAAATTGTTRTRLAFLDLGGRSAYEKVPPFPKALASGFENGILAWAPNGDRLAVVSQGVDTPSVWIVEPDGSEPYRKLVEFTGGPRIRGISWTDNQTIVIGKHDVASSDIVVLDSKQ